MAHFLFLCVILNLQRVRRINVPISLISRLRLDKGSIEMLVCAIMIKRRFQNSTLYDTRITNVMKFFHVSHKKAKKLLGRFKDSELFVCHSNGHVFAKSFKSREKVVYGKGKRKYVAFADYCRKMQLSETITLREAVRELRNTLITCAIDSRERGNLNNVRHGTMVEDSYQTKAMTHRLIGCISGLSRSSAGRYVNKLIEDRRVSKTKIVAECVIEELNETTEMEWRSSHSRKNFFVWHSIEYGFWSGWQHHGCIYALKSRKESNSFRNVIHNYRRKCSGVKPKNSAEIDGKWKN